MSVVSLLLAALLFAPAPTDWSAVYEEVIPSVVPLQGDFGNGWANACTAIVVEGGVMLTAKHCLDHGKPVRTPYGPIEGDFPSVGELVILPAPPGVPGIPIAKNDPKIGSALAGMGYAWQMKFPMMQIGYVSIGHSSTFDKHIAAQSDAFPGPIFWFSMPPFHGMSGGPIVNPDGELITIMWFSDAHNPGEVISGGPTPSIIRNVVKAWIQHLDG